MAGKVGRNNPHKPFAGDIGETIVAALNMLRRALWPAPRTPVRIRSRAFVQFAAAPLRWTPCARAVGTRDGGEILRVKGIVQGAVQAILEAEMTEAVRAGKHERTEQRLGDRSGYYPRTRMTRVGNLELRVPQDREGRFSTEVFERYQRSEKHWCARWRRFTSWASRRAR